MTTSIAVQGVFFNTTGETGQTLENFKAVALIQDEIILEMYQLYPKMSPSQCWNRYAGFCVNQLGMPFTHTPPITSIRRSINTLTNSGQLERLRFEKVIGIYGRPECYWKLNK